MLIYLRGGSYASLYNRNGLDDEVVLNKDKRYKAIYEMKKENGYLRHYITKVDGEKVMIRETKLPKEQVNKQTAGELKDLLAQIVLNQLVKPLQKEPFSKTEIFGQKEMQIEKYKTSI